MPNRPYKLCFSTLGSPDLDLDATLSLAEQFDIQCLELRALEDRVDLPVYLSEQPGGFAAVKEKLQQLEGGAVVLGTSAKLVGGKEGTREDLMEFAKLAEALGTSYLRVFGGGKWGTPLTDGNFQEAMDLLNWWQRERDSHGWNVDLAIETHDAFSASPPLLDLFERLGRSVNIIWDSHHTWKLGGESPDYSWQQLGEFTRHVHIKDSISEPSARHPYTYVLPGRGEMPMQKVLQILRENNFSGSLALEWEKVWHPYLCDISEALAACRDDIGW